MNRILKPDRLININFEKEILINPAGEYGDSFDNNITSSNILNKQSNAYRFLKKSIEIK